MNLTLSANAMMFLQGTQSLGRLGSNAVYFLNEPSITLIIYIIIYIYIIIIYINGSKLSGGGWSGRWAYNAHKCHTTGPSSTTECVVRFRHEKVWLKL